ncbi:hypothetical protein K461DRAFT_270414 [Myriangium duriaei CBS 260.36]|uniref:F-box domain-containing protein n=1 Tax=Myriangium duriaei CBS 260.36 TaxID=1168546 RepID=A0A9P4IZS8_9PEZI|nr:hypothetical protein K461DRAFT_270414 [Myriangium duriaei CBS 260.36]
MAITRSTTRRAAPRSAPAQVFAIPELLSLILSFLCPPASLYHDGPSASSSSSAAAEHLITLLTATRVSRLWRHTILTSRSTREALFLAPTHDTPGRSWAVPSHAPWLRLIRGIHSAPLRPVPSTVLPRGAFFAPAVVAIEPDDLEDDPPGTYPGRPWLNPLLRREQGRRKGQGTWLVFGSPMEWKTVHRYAASVIITLEEWGRWMEGWGGLVGGEDGKRPSWWGMQLASPVVTEVSLMGTERAGGGQFVLTIDERVVCQEGITMGLLMENLGRCWKKDELLRRIEVTTI